jgi:cyclic beta-1,2-glucan synthetase
MIEVFAPWQTPELEAACPLPASELARWRETLTLEAAPRIYRELGKKLEALRADEVSPETARHLRAALEKSERLAEDVVNRLTVIASTARSLADGMDFSVLIDAKKKQFSVGYEEREGAISKYNYDLLASEARTAVFVAIAKGEASHEVWFRLKRSYRSFKRQEVLLSWSGTMFEYLMPCLWLRRYPNTLLGQGIQAILRAQQKFGEQNGIPWGISESSCADRNPDGHYRYHAFGVPGMALHRDDCSDDLVVAPYATFLGMMFDVNAALKNLRRMKNLGLLSTYGFYEAADFTPKRNCGKTRHVVVRNWMAHHQGMTLVAAANVLCDFEMQRRFHAEPRVAAIERVLHERQPRVLPYEETEDAMKESGPALADLSAPHPVFRDLVPKAL